MATENSLKQLKEALGRLRAVDTDKLLRKDLGVASLADDFKEDLEKIRSLAMFAEQHAGTVHDEYTNNATETLSNIAGEMNSQAQRSPADYINRRESFLKGMRNHIAEASRWLPMFAGSAVLERGFLEDEGIRREYERVVEQLKAETESTLTQVKEQADAAVSDAKKLADEIEARARKSATRMSVREAQNQFSSATGELQKKANMWGVIAGVSVLVLLALAVSMNWWPLPESDAWPVALYHSLLRIFVLTTVGAAVAVCVRLFRAHLHMVERNRHRVRVANSMESFVNSAHEQEQRDLLLAKLAEAVIDFGDSGIIKSERDESPSGTASGDLVGRILAALRRGS